MAGGDGVSIRLNPEFRDRIERIRQEMAEKNPQWSEEGISDSAVIRHCLLLCDPIQKT